MTMLRKIYFDQLANHAAYEYITVRGAGANSNEEDLP